MKTVSFYDDSGKILGTLVGSDESIETTIQESNYKWIAGDWFGKPVYVKNGEITDLMPNPTTIQGFTLNDVPIPSTIVINNQYYESNDSTVNLSFEFPGTYNVRIISFPYLTKEFKVENPA